MSTVVGTVADLRRFPVKSMLGEQLQRAPLTDRGVLGDRAYALVDDETGKVVSVKRPNRWGRMFELTATTDGDTVRVALPDGDTFAIDDPALLDRLSAFFGRKVSLTTMPPEGPGFDEAWVGDLKEGVPPYPGAESQTIDGEEFIDGGGFMRVTGNLFNLGAIHLITTGTTKQLSEVAPDTRFDPHRFRPNIVVDTPEVGFVETDWPGRTVSIGDVELFVGMTVPRCVMTTLQQGDLPADREVLRTLAKHNAVDFMSVGTPYPCAGVYADVTVPGEIAVGDTVTID